MRFLVLGNPENRRVELFREACARLGLPAPGVLSWERYLADQETLTELLGQCDVLRIESSGENFGVEAMLVRKGEGVPVSEKEFHKGRIQNHAAWFRGWVETLAEIDKAVAHRIPIMNAPMEIATIFDKFYCQKYLAEAGIPVPRILGEAASADEVFRLMDREGVNRVFVKPRHGSSASGVVALQRSKNRILATSSAHLSGGRLYNSLKISRYEDHEDVVKILDLLGQESLLVEQWFPKAIIDQRITDFRVLVIAGKTRHVVARTSRSPITNLHLGNARGDLVQIKQILGDEIWNQAMKVCEEVSRKFPGSFYFAVDLMIGASHQSVAVAEVNAFGDLLPNLLSEGEETYEAELKAWLVKEDEPPF